jgi:hypothetical protein
MSRTKNYKDFNQFVKNVTSTEELRFRGMSQEDYEKGINDGKFNDVGWTTPKNGRRYTMSELAHQIKDPRRMEFSTDYHFPPRGRPHPKSKHSSERTREPQKIVMGVSMEKISFWQKLVNIFKSNKDGKENTVGDSYEK